VLSCLLSFKMEKPLEKFYNEKNYVENFKK
jgi:hypothetical protein